MKRTLQLRNRQPGAAEGHTLERYGKALPYRSIAEWEQPVTAVIRLSNGRPFDIEALAGSEIRDLGKVPAQ